MNSVQNELDTLTKEYNKLYIKYTFAPSIESSEYIKKQLLLLKSQIKIVQGKVLNQKILIKKGKKS